MSLVSLIVLLVVVVFVLWMINAYVADQRLKNGFLIAVVLVVGVVLLLTFLPIIGDVRVG